MAFSMIPQEVKLGIRHLVMSMGIDLYLRSDDRRVLETIIFPYFADQFDFKKILFVGCGWYTRGYRKFFRDKNFWTLDIDPAKRRYGAKSHIIDSLANIGRYFRDNELDLIVCNGV